MNFTLESLVEDKNAARKKIIRFKVIRPVYETLIVKEAGIDYPSLESPLNSSSQVYDLFRFLSAEAKEHFLTIHLDSKNRILAIERVSTGSLSASVVHPREVFKSCLLSSAAAIVCLHNHPSGSTEPSREDIEITQRLREGADLLGIRLLDHVIIGSGTYLSFADRGLL